MFARYLLLFTLLLMGSFPVAAQMRCGTEIINDGELKPEVLQACGPPYAVLNADDGFIDNERWVYNFGPNEFLMIVEFRNDEVVRIDSDGYGFIETDPAPPRLLD